MEESKSYDYNITINNVNHKIEIYNNDLKYKKYKKRKIAPSPFFM